MIHLLPEFTTLCPVIRPTGTGQEPVQPNDEVPFYIVILLLVPTSQHPCLATDSRCTNFIPSSFAGFQQSIYCGLGIASVLSPAMACSLHTRPAPAALEMGSRSVLDSIHRCLSQFPPWGLAPLGCTNPNGR